MPVIMRYNRDLFQNDPINRCNILIDYITQRIEKNKNFLCCISGETGSGKSLCTLYIAEKLQEAIMPNVPFTIDQVVFKSTDFMRLIYGNNSLPSGSVIVWDEIGVGFNAKKSMSALNIALNNTFQVFRSRRYVVLSSTPDFNFIDKSTRKLLHCYLNTKSINYKDNTCKVLCQLMQYNVKMGKIYYHNFHLAIKGHPIMRIRNIYTGLPSKQLMDDYQARKEAYNDKIFKQTLNILKSHDSLEPLTEKQQKIYEMNQSGLNMAQIGEALGLHPSSISSQIHYIEKKGYEVKRFYDRPYKNYKIMHEEKLSAKADL